MNSIKAALAEYGGSIPLQQPTIETISLDCLDRSVKQAHETQKEIGDVKKKLSRRL